MVERIRKLITSALVVGVLVLGAAPAVARPVADHDGDANNDPVVVTEDDDDNDGGTPNNVVDDGDNRHPSGRDRSVERGNGSPNQGSTEVDPDDDGRGPDRSNGGPDRPGGSGGEDLADQDGNNGCGNDDDFEDDNEGRCGVYPIRPRP